MNRPPRDRAARVVAVLTAAVIGACPVAVAVTATAPHEAASPAVCQTAAARPPIATLAAALARTPENLPAHFKLADSWSDAGCFNDALQVLQAAQAHFPADPQLQTRLRVAKSLVGEEHFFDDLDRANTQARVKRASFRCTALADADACSDALQLKPGDPALLIAHGDALLHAQRPSDAVAEYRRAAALAPDFGGVDAKLAAAEARLPAPATAAPPSQDAAAEPTPPLLARVPAGTNRRYSNDEPASESH